MGLENELEGEIWGLFLVVFEQLSGVDKVKSLELWFILGETSGEIVFSDAGGDRGTYVCGTDGK